MIPYGKHAISEEDIQAVVEVLRSGRITQGPAIEQLERQIADLCGAKHAVAVNSATSALHLSCLALGLGPGNTLWTSPNTFVASANCARYCGANVDFVDIDPRTYNLSLEALDAKLQLASRANCVPKVVVPVHFAGQPLDTGYLKRLAARYGFSVIEDAAHAIGARYDGNPVGSCNHSDITVFSFHPVKIITTGEGGIATTNDDNLARKLRLLRSHGTTRDPDRLMNLDVGDWYYEQHDLGFNYRITDIQAALGISQLKRLNRFLEARRLRVERYRHDLRDLALILPYEDPRARSAWHLFVVQIDEKKTRKSRRQIFDNLRKRGIQVHVHYIPVHLQPYYRSLGFSENQFPVAEAYYRRALTLPLYATLSEEDQQYVVEELRNALQ